MSTASVFGTPFYTANGIKIYGDAYVARDVAYSVSSQGAVQKLTLEQAKALIPHTCAVCGDLMVADPNTLCPWCEDMKNEPIVCAHAAPNFHAAGTPIVPYSHLYPKVQFERQLRPMLTGSHRVWPICKISGVELNIAYQIISQHPRERSHMAAAWECVSCAQKVRAA